MRQYACATALVMFGLSTVPSHSVHAAPSVQAYALSAGGESILGSEGGGFSCATFGPDSRTANFQGVYQVGLPTSGPCGVGVDARSASAASGAVSVSSTLAVGFGSSVDPRAFVGQSTGRAGFGNLGVRADATYSGSVDAFTVIGAQAFGQQTESMTFNGGIGSGFFQPTFTIDGSLFNVGRADSQLAFFYSVGSGPGLLGFRIQNTRGDITYYGPSGYVPSFAGMSLTGDLVNGLTVAGSTTFTLNIPIAFGAATDITYALWAGTLPSSSVGLLTPSGGAVDFDSTVKLTGINVVGADGQPLDAFTITSGSGTLYDRNGVTASVPEPRTLVLMLLGLLGLTLARSRRSF